MIDPALLINRELSWMDFNRRVLEEAEDVRNPLLERCNFLGITASNLDEFFMVRVAGLKQQVVSNYTKADPSGMTPKEQQREVFLNVHRFSAEQQKNEVQLRKELEAEGIRIQQEEALETFQSEYLKDYFKNQIFQILTPISIDPERPLPYFAGRRLYIAIRLVAKKDGKSKDRHEVPRIVVVPVPANVEQWVHIPTEDGKCSVIPLENVVGRYLNRLYDRDKFKLAGVLLLRITRDSDLTIDDDAQDLMKEIEKSIKKRNWGMPIRLQWAESFVGQRADPWLLDFMVDKLSLQRRELFPCSGLVDLTAYSKLADAVERKDLEYLPQPPVQSPAFSEGDIFETISQGDILVHHPYESFDPVLSLLAAAAKDPQTLAIKQTLYRVSRHSPVVQALVDAAQNGKQVTVLVELKARFDEENNIGWARVLEQAGCHVIYGVPALKVHCKTLLIVRRENGNLKRYMHWGTGNYNDATAKHYTDMGLFTCDEEMGKDATELFNLLTNPDIMPKFRVLRVAPKELRPFLKKRIDAEIQNAREGKPAYIAIKVNSLLDDKMIQYLYEASKAGVKIDLVVRGICSIRPGIEGVSDNIRVVSIIGRHLEHHRIYYFYDGGKQRVYLSSADWMPRNLDKRIEVCFPIKDPGIKERVLRILQAAIEDNEKAREMHADGSFVRINKPGVPGLQFQQWCYDQVCSRAGNGERPGESGL